MGYEPPSFEKLCEETDQLEGYFNKFASRYVVVSYSNLCSIAETDIPQHEKAKIRIIPKELSH
ncbi:Uncharacterised protein [Legionella donaldsonii]|uniref:Uncharacterized protein n=1 Tax=Legionella donaldsonii TaxID=45060 RepID=A0A378J7H1_9GAMM|nr:hypothetical protein [Legionella donaldsonii]STX43178.1 Uncharacterised protein [Legionella donaldsonii]